MHGIAPCISVTLAGPERPLGCANLRNFRSLAEILTSGEIEAGETTVLVPLLLDSGRTIRVNTTFDAGLLDAIDAAADQRGLTRSAFLASAAREKIEAQR